MIQQETIVLNDDPIQQNKKLNPRQNRVAKPNPKNKYVFMLKLF